MMPNAVQVPLAITSLQDIAQDYDAVFCDVWGVLHNGVSKFAPAEAALCDMRASGRPVVLVTNSPRRSHSVAMFLSSIGISPDAFDAIATSGDVTRALIKAAPSRLFHIGTEAHRELLDGLEVDLVGEDDAKTVLVTGLFDDNRETPADYAALLGRLAERRLPMICANPDIVAQRGDRMVWCAGALARDYAARGGDVQLAGKPFAPIYDFAAGRIGGIDGRRVLAIGDGLATDIKGANDYGLDALLILEGIHADALGDDPASVAAYLEREALSARYAMATLR
jgi:HAD superfamily hydrolase (TIGR01459 family)